MRKYWEDLNKTVDWRMDSEIDSRAYTSWVVILVMSIMLGIGLGFVATGGNNWRLPVNEAEAQTVPAGFVVNHTNLYLFDQIPNEYKIAAQNLRMMWGDRSVGGNINDGLNCLAATTDESAINSCRRNHSETAFMSPASELNWDFTALPLTRNNWTFLFDPGLGVTNEYTCPGYVTGQFDWIGCFLSFVRSNINLYDVISYQHSYLAVMPGQDNIISPTVGYFIDRGSVSSDIYDYERIENDFPGKKVIYWTTSLSRGIGTQVATDYNNAMRNFASTRNKVLLDAADIESHDPWGNPCYDNRDGVPYYVGTTLRENNPDDGLNIPAICQHYTGESEGGHLGSVSVGKIRLAKAYWITMAYMAGWRPDGSSVPTPVPTPTPTSTPVPTPTPVMPTPTPTPTPTSTPVPTPTPAPGAGPISVWGFAGNSVTDDINGCSGCSNSNTTWTSSGIYSGGYNFSNSGNSSLNLGGFPYLNNKSAFTVNVWVKPNFDQTSSIIGNVLVDGNNFNLRYLGPRNQWQLVLRNNSGTVYRIISNNITWTPGTWHMMTVTFDGSFARLYWDGAVNASFSVAGTLGPDNGTTTLGSAFNIAGTSFDGTLDELGIYDRALSNSEVSNLFNNPGNY